MKLTGRDATDFCLNPKPFPAILLHGEPESKIIRKYKTISAKLVGKNANTEMRVTELTSGELRTNKSLAIDAIKTVGFFPGHRLVYIKNGNDGLTEMINEIISNYQKGDAFLIVAANKLNPRSKLRKLFESNKNAVSIGVYPDPITDQEIELALKNVGLEELEIDARKNLKQIAKGIELNEFEQILEKLFLYKIKEQTPVSSHDLEKCLSMSLDIELNELVEEICVGNTENLSSLLFKLNKRTQNPTSTYIITNQYFRNLHTIAINPTNIEQALLKIRPPVFGVRRNKLIAHAKKWGVLRIEKALKILHETGLMLRSSKPAPQHALIERALIKISMLI